jgi:ATP-dependent helicase HepA
MKVTLGQRWISQAESQLGLGVIVAVSNRRVTIQFPAVDEERIYATDNNALSRVIYRPGDRITTKDEIELWVIDVQEVRGITFYSARDADKVERIISELDLSCFVHFTTPRQRLLSGQIDKDALYRLRIDTLYLRDELKRSPVRGLLGCRTSLLPHQVYIAAEVAQRHAPRVLLADEVGLGKTIEAGMIVHQQLHTGRAKRVLIITPASLQHQWLVEMLRRFNLRFSLFDEERLQALGEDTTQNPFEGEQLVLCALPLLSDDDQVLELASDATWDLIVVDEAHHLYWSEDQPSAAYQCIEHLAGRGSGLLLLTATPEQAGLDSHFARLRLLDPARFHSLQSFQEEQQHYQQINTLARQLLSSETLTADMVSTLQAHLGSDWQAPAEQDANTDAIVKLLLDRHGTGRVMFRNTRAAIPDFPERKLHAYPLALPDLYRTDHNTLASAYPEQGVDDELWITHDPRVQWLQTFLKKVRPAKVLIICAHAKTATALEFHLHMRAGIRCSAFHERLTLIERDRAAAWFADEDNGAQALVCSEIGSEGRNFQFARHLVLFDLPHNPDLLEQRIGRLDRIGQRNVIDIHVPYLEDSAQQTLFRWYHEGINLFTHSCAAAYSILEHFRAPLEAQMHCSDEGLATLIEETRHYTQHTRQTLHDGRDPLLELNSCNGEKAQELIDAINTSQDNHRFMQFLEQLFDQLGVEHDFHSEHARILRPTEHMLIDHIPGLNDSGVTVTVDRDQALAREDMEYLSWEHPMLIEPIDAILSGEIGNTSLVSISIKGLPPGTLLLEAIYSVNCLAATALQLDRFLATEPIRVLLNPNGQDLATVLSHQQLNQLAESVKRSAGQAIIKRVREELDKLLDQAEVIAASRLPAIVTRAIETMRNDLSTEAARLRALRAVNNSIRHEEIEFVEQRIASSHEHLERTSLQLQGLRLVINT